jgi:hypothetical protein
MRSTKLQHEEETVQFKPRFYRIAIIVSVLAACGTPDRGVDIGEEFSGSVVATENAQTPSGADNPILIIELPYSYGAVGYELRVVTVYLTPATQLRVRTGGSEQAATFSDIRVGDQVSVVRDGSVSFHNPPHYGAARVIVGR